MELSKEDDDETIYNRRINNIKLFVNKFNEKFPTIAEIDSYIENESNEDIPNIIPQRPSDFNIYQANLKDHLKSVFKCYEECAYNLESSIETFARNKLKFEQDTYNFSKIITDKEEVRISLRISEVENFLVNKKSLVKNMLGKKLYSSKLRNMVEDFMIAFRELGSICPESVIYGECLSFRTYIMNEIIAEFDNRIIRFTQSGYYDEKINELFNISLVVSEENAHNMVNIYTETILMEFKKELTDAKEKEASPYIKAVCDKAKFYLTQKCTFKHLPHKRLFYLATIKSLFSYASKCIQEKLSSERNFRHENVMHILEYALNLENTVIKVDFENDNLSIELGYERIYAETKKGLLSRVLEPLFNDYVEAVTKNSIEIIEKSKINHYPRNEDVKDGVLPMTRMLLDPLISDLSVIHNANGLWPLLIYSNAIQNIIQKYIRFLSSNLSRTNNINHICMVACSAEHVHCFLEREQQENIEKALPELLDQLLYNEEVLALKNIVGTAIKSLSSAINDKFLNCYFLINKNVQANCDDGVNDVSKFIIDFQKNLKKVKPVIDLHLGNSPFIYWNTYINFLDLTVSQFSNTFKKLKPIDENSCQKLILDIYYLFDTLKSHPTKNTNIPEDMSLSSSYYKKCSQYKSELENVLKIILQLFNGTEIIAELFIKLFPDKDIKYLLYILDLKGVSPDEERSVLNDYNNVKSMHGKQLLSNNT